MRTSGGRGAEGWILAIPVVALIVATAMGGGGPQEMLVSLEGTIREAVTSVTDFISRLF